MSNAAAFTRSAAVYRLVELLEAQRIVDPELVPTGTTIGRGLPRDPMTDPVIGLGDLTYVDTEPAGMRSVPLNTNDVAELEVLTLAWENGTDTFQHVDELAEACGELVRRTLAWHPQLDDGTDGLPGLVSAVLTEVDGPNPWRTADGVGSGMLLVVKLESRITTGG